jgi:hypothetical protein
LNYYCYYIVEGLTATSPLGERYCRSIRDEEGKHPDAIFNDYSLTNPHNYLLGIGKVAKKGLDASKPDEWTWTNDDGEAVVFNVSSTVFVSVFDRSGNETAFKLCIKVETLEDY